MDHLTDRYRHHDIRRVPSWHVLFGPGEEFRELRALYRSIGFTHSRQHHPVIAHQSIHSFGQLNQILVDSKRKGHFSIDSSAVPTASNAAAWRTLWKSLELYFFPNRMFCFRVDEKIPRAARCSFSGQSARKKSLTRFLWNVTKRAMETSFAIEKGDFTGQCLEKRTLDRWLTEKSSDFREIKQTLPDPTGPMTHIKSPGTALKTMFLRENRAF